MSVRELADPSTVKMGEAASPSAGCSEVDADVVQIEASLRIARHGHRHLLLFAFVSPVFLAGRRDRIPVDGLGAACRSHFPCSRINAVLGHWQHRSYLVALVAGGWQSREVDGPELGGLRHGYDGQCRSWSNRVGLGLVLGDPGRGRSGGAPVDLLGKHRVILSDAAVLAAAAVSIG